ncbi:MAG: polyhydroxyalkanoic acid system family protein [Candidatus Kaiserbacteria bacterium]|nr:polyhydroxyalkanoic acid system family protein [Candidatus Kaiserbacteria bacterium]
MSFEASAKSSESKDVSSVDSEKKRNFKIAIVKTGQALEDQARDIAESRMTASKEELRGVKGFFEKIWKHNLAREYYRQREIAKSKAEIQASKNLFEGEGGAEQHAHAEAMNAVVDRFVQEYEEAIHIDAGEERRKVGVENAEDTRLSTEVRALVKEYASGKIDEEGFNAERSRIIAYATGLTGEQLASAVHHTDNMLEIAKQAKIAVEHGVSIDTIDQEIEIVIGKAKVGVRSEANMNRVDRIVAKMQASKLGRFVNETTIATGVAIAYTATVGISQRLASSRAFAWGTFGASALVGGAIAGMRESVRVEEERSQHSRERAKGEKNAPDSERREEMEQLIYKTETAKNLTESLRNIRDDLQDSAEFQTALSTLAQAESRIQLSDRERVDLISYTDFKSIERERLELDIARAEVKVKLRKIAETTGDVLPKERTFDDFYTLLLNIQESELRGGHEGMEKKDELFKKMKRRKIAGATAKAVLTGLVIGGTVQEVGAFMNSSQVGLAENALGMQGNRPPESVTALEGVRRWFAGEEAFVRPMGRHVLSQNINLELPEGVEITENPQGAGEFTFTKDGEVLSDKIQFDNGVLTPASEEILKSQGVIISQSTARISGLVEGKTTGQGFVEQNPDLFQKIHRKFWYDNNTSVFDENELKLHWGGVKGSGVDARGNYVFDVAKMTPDGSAFKDLSIDAQETMKGGKLKLLLSLSKDSQSSVVEVSIDERGRAIIDPNSEVGKMFFKVEEGKLAFVGKFAEVAHEAGVAQDGGKQFEVLATHIGKGVEEVPMPTQITQEVPVTTFEVTDKAPYVEPPFVIPVFGRRPLERMDKAIPESVIEDPDAEEIEHIPYGESKLKRHYTEISKYRNSPAEIQRLIDRMQQGDGKLATKYAFVLERLKKLNNYKKLSHEDKLKIDSELEAYNSRFKKEKTISEYVSIEINRVYNKIENILLEEAKVGERVFEKEFYERSPLVQGLEQAEEVVLILDHPIGDAVLTVPVINALSEYFGRNSSKKISVVSSSPKLFISLEDQFPGMVKIVDYKQLPAYFSDTGKRRFVINAHKHFENYKDVGLSKDQVEDPSYLMSVDWASWKKEEVPMSHGETKKYDPVPARILRGFEIMLGQKLFPEINEMDHFIEKGHDFDSKEAELRKKFDIKDNEKVITVSAGSSIVPKEYNPERWKVLFQGIFERFPETHILFLDDPDSVKNKRYGDMVDEIVRDKGYRISRVKSQLDEMNTIMSMSELTITPDTGLGHYAGALGVPNIMLFLSDPVLWSTAKTARIKHRVAFETYRSQRGSYSEAWGSPNDYHVRVGGNEVGASDLEPEKIITEVERIFSERGIGDELVLGELTKDYLKEKGMIKSGRWDERQSAVQKVLNDDGHSKKVKDGAVELLKALKRLEAEYVAGHEKVPVAGDSHRAKDEQPDFKPELSVEKEMKPNLEKSYQHSLPKTEALSRVKKMLEQARKENARKITNLKEKWVGNKNSFSFNINGQEIKGVIEVKDNEVLIQGELPRVALFFKSAIMKVLDTQAEKILAK